MKRKRTPPNMRRKNFSLTSLAGWILLCEAAGVVGSVFTVSAIPTWYASLTKPPIAPPNYLFGPVWVILYALMGIAAYRVSRSGKSGHEQHGAIRFFLFHLLLNALWSPVFFGLKQIPLAFVTIAAVWLTLIMLIFRYEKLDRVSAFLLLPYLYWVTFATVLNYYFWYLNA